MSESLKLRTMSIDETFNILRTSWHHVKNNYFQILGAILVSIIIFYLVSLPLAFLGSDSLITGFIGSLPSIILSRWYGLGCGYAFRKMDFGQPVTVGTFFEPLTNPRFRNGVMPIMIFFIVVQVILSGISLYLISLGGSLIFLGPLTMMIPSLLIQLIMYNSIFMVFFHGIDKNEAISKAITVAKINMIPLTVLGLLALGFTLACLVCLIFPVFFVAMPTLIGLPYLTYRATCEGKVIERPDLHAPS